MVKREKCFEANASKDIKYNKKNIKRKKMKPIENDNKNLLSFFLNKNFLKKLPIDIIETRKKNKNNELSKIFIIFFKLT